MKLAIEESVLRQALEALEFYNRRCEEQGFYSPNRQPLPKNAITALRSTLEAAEKVEPVAYAVINGDRVAQLSVTQDPFYPHSTPLYSHPAPAVLEGWQLVPKEPTNEMRSACRYERSKSPLSGSDDIWKAMLAAAPTPEET